MGGKGCSDYFVAIGIESNRLHYFNHWENFIFYSNFCSYLFLLFLIIHERLKNLEKIKEKYRNVSKRMEEKRESLYKIKRKDKGKSKNMRWCLQWRNLVGLRLVLGRWTVGSCNLRRHQFSKRNCYRNGKRTSLC